MFLKLCSNFLASSLTATLHPNQEILFISYLKYMSQVKLTWALFMHIPRKMEVITLWEASELDSAWV